MTSTGKAQLRVRLLRSVGAGLKDHGFTLKLSKDAFLRKWDDRTERFRPLFRDAESPQSWLAILILMISNRATALQMERIGGEFSALKFDSSLLC